MAHFEVLKNRLSNSTWTNNVHTMSHESKDKYTREAVPPCYKTLESGETSSRHDIGFEPEPRCSLDIDDNMTLIIKDGSNSQINTEVRFLNYLLQDLYACVWFNNICLINTNNIFTIDNLFLRSYWCDVWESWKHTGHRRLSN